MRMDVPFVNNAEILNVVKNNNNMKVGDLRKKLELIHHRYDQLEIMVGEIENDGGFQPTSSLEDISVIEMDDGNVAILIIKDDMEFDFLTDEGA